MEMRECVDAVERMSLVNKSGSGRQFCCDVRDRNHAASAEVAFQYDRHIGLLDRSSGFGVSLHAPSRD